MYNNIKISVILPCYNVSQYIERCMNSIVSQSFKEYEIICINDGSTDNTLQELQKWEILPNLTIYSFRNQGLSQARNEGIIRAKGEFIYFLDPDDFIEPETLTTAYNQCIKDNSDAVQFCYRSIDEVSQKESWVSLGNKSKAIYEGQDIINDLLPRFIGFSDKKLSNYGTPSFSEDAEMNSVWRFLYKRTILIENEILFPKGVKMIEDKIFNATFFCYANRISVIKDVLYNYMIKKTGLMYHSLNDPLGLVKDKMDGVTERARLRRLYKNNHNIDIFPLYVGSLILSAFELMIKLSSINYKLGIAGIQKYLALEDVQDAINFIHPNKTPLKIRIPLYALKNNLSKILYSILWLYNNLKNIQQLK